MAAARDGSWAVRGIRPVRTCRRVSSRGGAPPGRGARMRVATDTEKYATKQELRELGDRLETFEADRAGAYDTVVRTLGQLGALVGGIDGKVDGLGRKVGGLDRKVDAICGHFGIRVQDRRTWGHGDRPGLATPSAAQ